MNFKETLDKYIDIIDENRNKIVTGSLVILGVIVLTIVLVLSSDELSVKKEANVLLKNIENREYNIALDHYNNYKNQFSEPKMKRLNKALSGKINQLLTESGDKYISNEITKEHYIGIINTINALDTIEIDIERILKQSQRVTEMYINENINYEVAISYMNTISSLNGIVNELDIDTQTINEIHESRNIYKSALKNQNNYMYYEAILEYEKILQIDKKYYELAQKNKDKCIEEMYSYYLEKAKECDENGNYEDALKYIQYIKMHYENDENILKLEKDYSEKLSIYTLSSNDIITLISKKSGRDKKNLSISSFYQMVKGEKYYYVELYEYEILVNELLINAKTKEVYSYKDSTKDYNKNYYDGYFRVKTGGDIEFAISEEKANFIVSNKLEQNNISYKDVYTISKEEAIRYIKNKEELDTITKNSENLYYYSMANKGWFKKKDVFIVNMYTEEVYIISEDNIQKY